MAKVAIACPHCAKRYALAEQSLGKMMKCPACQEEFVAEAEGAEPAAAPALKPAMQPAGGSLLDDDDLFTSAASAPAVKRPAKSSGDGPAKKGKKGSGGSQRVKMYNFDGIFHGEVPWELLLKHHGFWMVWGGIAYQILSGLLAFAGIRVPLDPYLLIAAVVVTGSGFVILNSQYYAKWTDFAERKLTMGQAPEPRWLQACQWGTILVGGMAGTAYLAFSPAKPKPAVVQGPQAAVPGGGATDAEVARLRAALADLRGDDQGKVQAAMNELMRLAIADANRAETTAVLDALLDKPWIKTGFDPRAVTAGNVLMVMQRLQNATTGPTLAKRLPGTNAELRALLLDALGRIKDPATAGAVAATLAIDKPAALKTLGLMGTAGEAGMIQALAHPDADTRIQAANLLAEWGSASAISALEAELKLHPDNAAARTAIEKIKAKK